MNEKRLEVKNVGGIARKAIEEGWESKKVQIKKELEIENLKYAQTEREKQQQRKEEEEQKRIAAQKGDAAVTKFKGLSEKDQKEFLDGFREYLVEQGSKIVLNAFDKGGVEANTAVSQMFRLYTKNYFFDLSSMP